MPYRSPKNFRATLVPSEVLVLSALGVARFPGGRVSSMLNRC